MDYKIEFKQIFEEFYPNQCTIEGNDLLDIFNLIRQIGLNLYDDWNYIPNLRILGKEKTYTIGFKNESDLLLFELKFKN